MALDWVEETSQRGNFTFLVTPNVDHLVTLHETGREEWRTAFRNAVIASDLCINDSRILAKIAKLSAIELSVVPGSDLVRNLIDRQRDKSGTIALVGGAAREARWLSEALPDWRVAHFAPPMGVRDSPTAQTEIIDFVERERANYVFLAIGAPQSEIVAHAIAQRGRACGVALCIGASIEFLSGAQRRAPRWMQLVGLEWFFRLASNPQRFWRRYLLRGPQIFTIWWNARRGP